MSSGSNTMYIGGTFNYQNRTSRGMDSLMEWVATGASHNSDELYDAPKCHPHTRIAVLDDIMRWVNESESAGDDFMMWLFGPAGAGKSAIAKRIAEVAAEKDLLIADFFFCSTSPTRNTKDRLITTLAYQLTVSIPGTRSYIEDAIERDPAIFNKNIPTQINTLLIRPLRSVSSTHIVPSQKLIIIDGLDECKGSQAQLAILEAISRSFIQHNLSIKFLVVSRPEPDLVTSFNCEEPLRYIHRRLALDGTYRPDDDIRLFFSDNFKHIRLTHPLKLTIPISWPTQETLEILVAKSSGQFIYASTVVKFVKSRCHQPTARLKIILGISPPGTLNPFAQLDALYNHLLSSVADIQITLRVLSLYVMAPYFAHQLRHVLSPELFLSLEPGHIQLALINLSSIVTYDGSSGTVTVLHASLVDFLSDRRRSTTFYIDKASAYTEFFRRVLQCVNGSDGIIAGDTRLFFEVIQMFSWIPKGSGLGQLQSDILNFDLDAFINASIRWKYKKHAFLNLVSTIETFDIWNELLIDVGLEGRDKEEALDRLHKSVASRLQIYQADWRLQLLLILAASDAHSDVTDYGCYEVPYCRCVDILLEMDGHDLHLADRDALDLRHTYFMTSGSTLVDMITSCLDGDAYASAALHCIRFLSDPPKYFKRNDERSEMGLIYAEWQATCDMTLDMLCVLLQRANASPELVQCIRNHDIHPAVQKDFSVDRVWRVLDGHILEFLHRQNMCPNWRTRESAIQPSLILTHQQSSKFDENNASSDEDEEWEATRHLIRQRLDQCCSNIHDK